MTATRGRQRGTAVELVCTGDVCCRGRGEGRGRFCGPRGPVRRFSLCFLPQCILTLFGGSAGVQGPSQPQSKGGEGSMPAGWGHAECVRRRAAVRGRIWAPCAPLGTKVCAYVNVLRFHRSMGVRAASQTAIQGRRRGMPAEWDVLGAFATERRYGDGAVAGRAPLRIRVFLTFQAYS